MPQGMGVQVPPRALPFLLLLILILLLLLSLESATDRIRSKIKSMSKEEPGPLFSGIVFKFRAP